MPGNGLAHRVPFQSFAYEPVEIVSRSFIAQVNFVLSSSNVATIRWENKVSFGRGFITHSLHSTLQLTLRDFKGHNAYKLV